MLEILVAGYDLGNEPYYWELAELQVNSTTKLKDVYPYNSRKYSFGDYLDWLNPGFGSVFQNVDGSLQVPARFQPVFDDVQV